MRRPAIRQQISRTLSVPAPVGGWNTRDMLAEMKPNEAVILDNMFCLTSSVRVRPGSVDYVTAIPDDVHTLMAYRSITGTSELFAAAGTEVYDVSVAGVCGSPVLAGLANDDWQHLIFGTSAGHYMIAVNGSHLPIIYDGSAWGNIFSATFSNAISGGGLTSVGTLCTCVMTNPHNMHTGMSITVSGASQTAYNGTFVITVINATTFTYVAASTPSASPATGSPSAAPTVNFAITVANPLNFIAITQHKNRIWFAEKDTLKAWYMGTNAIGGAAAAFDLSALFSRGGYLMALGTWTLDGGAGLDDLLVFVTSEGQVAVYRGTDPSVAANWTLVGVYMLAQPIGRNCLQKFGGDLLMLTRQGMLPLSKALISADVTDRMTASDKIAQTFSDYGTLYAANDGWQQVLFYEENALLVNVPVSLDVSYQLVMNTTTGAWSRFTGWNARCWERFESGIYFAAGDKVVQAWTGNTDSGAPISFEGLQAFTYANAPTQLKQVKMLRPIIATESQPNILLGVNADFDTSAPTGIPTFVPATAGLWDTAEWDLDYWGGDQVIRREWQAAFAMGYSFAAHMVGTISASSFNWISTDYVVEGGGVI
jgi:hypothetical protein